MFQNRLTLFPIALLCIAFNTGVWANRSILNDVVAVVGNQPITQLDLSAELGKIKKRKIIRKEKRNVESLALDSLIGKAIVEIISVEESITISPERIKAAIDKEMIARNIVKEEDFARVLKRSMGITLEEYKDELRRQLQTQQIVQLRVSVPNPSPAQVEEWYALNKNKIGKKYTYRMIMKKFSSDNELSVAKTMSQARAKAGNSTKSFASAAVQFSDHASAKNGGLMTSQRLDEVAKNDPLLAGILNSTRAGQTSQVVRSPEKNAYYIIRVENTRNIPMEEVYDQVRALLFSQNEQVAYAEWVKQQRKRVSVTIHMKNYQE